MALSLAPPHSRDSVLPEAGQENQRVLPHPEPRAQSSGSEMSQVKRQSIKKRALKLYLKELL